MAPERTHQPPGSRQAAGGSQRDPDIGTARRADAWLSKLVVAAVPLTVIVVTMLAPITL
jgi:hypothetical protein